jgi:hypothetical protein
VLVYRLVQIELAVEQQRFIQGFYLLGLQIGSDKSDDWFIQSLDHRIGVAVYGGVENIAPMDIAIR